MERINYLYASDNNFAKVLGVSLYSLCKFNYKNINNIYIISQDISVENKKRLNKISQDFNKKINFIEMPDFNKVLGEEADIKRYSASMFSRIIIDTLLPKEVEKIIYLDCDTLVNSDLTELWRIDLKNKVMGAVNDYRSVYYQRNLGIKDNNCYINSGVLLIDVNLYRKKEYEKKLILEIKKFNGAFEFPDNDAICRVMQDDIVLLPLKYNVSSIFYMTKLEELKKIRKPNIINSDIEIENSKKNPSVIHFTTCFLMNGRPWLKRMQSSYDTKIY